MVKEWIVLGHKVTGRGIEVDKAKVEAIERLPPPHDVKGIRSFLGHTGFYRRFIKNFSQIALPMTKLLQKFSRFKFSDDCMIAFNKLKQALINAPVIKPPNYDKHFDLICKASYDAIWVTLGQYDGTTFNVIHYANKTLNDAQKRYPHIEKELLAIVFGCDKFKSYIYESKVRVHTDRQGIKEIITRKDVKPWLIRWILLLQEFDL